MKFRSIVSSLNLNVSNYSVNRCPDQYVGTVSKLMGIRRPAMARLKIPGVLLILESPHIDEFKGELGPAKGKTGKNIKQYFNTVDGLKRINGIRPVVLINAIQYQCSLNPINLSLQTVAL